MKFGADLLQIPAAANPVGQVFDRAELLDELGFDFATVGHHRFAENVPSSTFTLLSAVAARTSRLRIGPGVIVLPAYHPLDVAEQISTLDQISQGRVFLNAGVGYRPLDFAAVPGSFEARGPRMTEALEILNKVWTEEDVTYRGEHFSFSSLTLYPRPVQKPHPEIWVGAMFRRAVERAGRLADVWYGGLMETLSDLVPLLEQYRSAAAEAGRPGRVCLKRSFGIASRRSDLEETWMPGYLDYRRYALKAGARWAPSALDRKLVIGETVGIDEVAEDRAVVGTADECVREIQRCREITGCEYLALNLDGHGRDPEQLEAQLRLFAREVMPAFRD